MKIRVFTSKQNSQELDQHITKLTDIYYPCLLTKWQISYTGLFKKKCTQKRVILTNLIKGDSSFGNENPTENAVSVESNTVMKGIYSATEAHANAKEMLRRYYMHYVRVWSVPQITCLSENIIYFPYTVLSSDKSQKGKSKLMLYEPVSNLTDKLAKFPEIEQFYQLQQRR